MIVDCHTQIWDSRAQLGRGAPSAIVAAEPTRHLEAVDPVDRAIVLAFKSRYLDAEIPNSYVADYVRQHAAKLVGFAGIDPTEPNCLDELRRAHEELGLKGVTVSPALQNFHPADTRLARLYEQCVRRGLPIVFEQDLRNSAAKLEFARPLALDEVCQEYPELRVVVAHMGYPWIEETVVLLGKHQNVYADIAGLLSQPWRTYQALLAAYEYGVMNKLLFGSGFPHRSPAACIETLYSLHQLSFGTNLIAIPREQLRGIVERDALSLLGLERRAPTSNRYRAAILTDDE